MYAGIRQIARVNFMRNQNILHYKILAKLGEGGMGVVYKAEDTKLKRLVAIKFLPRQTSASAEERERFKIEAQAAAALNHPNIATIYAIEEVDGDIFMVMEFIDGKELQQVASGRLQVEKIIEIATQIAEGLQAAHAKGVTHRDIKSSNIMVTESGQVKIMDFGLAKIAGGAQLTKDHSTLGTAAYMSPEQARGEPVDHRTDIWAFGVVLYEMLTGQLPFRGVYEQAVIYSILNEEPKAIADLRDGVSTDLVQLVQKTLNKDADQRYQNMQALLADLRQPVSAPIVLPKAEKSIVVLPFKNISPDPENEYFSDGLTEEIIADLSKVQALRVISRTSAMKLKATDKDVKTIGRDLQVQYALEGSVRKAGNSLRITAQLIDAATDAHLWAEKYSGTLDDVFDIQEKVSRAIVDALKMKLSPEEQQKIAERPIANVQAYDLYIRARHEILQFSAEGLERALKLLQQGLELAGENVLLLAAKGYAHWQFFNAGIKAEEAVLQEAEQSVQRIFSLQPESVYGYRLLGLIQVSRGNPRASVRYFARALQIDPNDPDSLMWLTLIYSTVGRSALAEPLIQKLIAIDPLTPSNYMFACAPPFYDGRFAEALESIRASYELDSENIAHRFFYFFLLLLNKNFDEAFALVDLMLKDAPEHFYTRLGSFLKFSISGEKEKALDALTHDIKIAARADWQYSTLVADGFALLKEKEQAYDWLENGVTCGFINYPYLARHDPFLENLRGEERFEKLMAKTKVAWEHFEG
ncbi:tetratricopeptide repeat protein [Cytophagia bacterium CHB2]|nr:tetratricopeptide repeat protein [Cytophagia bacterium CHB2]